MRHLQFTRGVYQGLFSMLVAALLLAGCKKNAEPSRKLAVEHANALRQLTENDVNQLRQGLSLGAKKLVPFLEKAGIEPLDYQTADRALRNARGYVPELRKAKSDFFLIAQSNGRITRNNLEQDDMAGEDNLRNYLRRQELQQSTGVVNSRD